MSKSEKPSPYNKPGGKQFLDRGAYKGNQASKILHPGTGVTLRTQEPLPIPRSNNLPISATAPTFSYDPLWCDKPQLPKYPDMPGLPKACRDSYSSKLVKRDSFEADWDRGY